MLNVSINILAGLVMIAEPNVVDASPVDANAVDEALAPDLADEGSLPAEDAAPRTLACAYGSDREDYNYCLALCEGDWDYNNVLGDMIRDTRNNRRRCARAAERYCRRYGQELEVSCMGQDLWP